MKKILLVFALVLFTVSSAIAQENNFGVKAGYANITAKAEVEGFSASVDESGFFVGLTSEFDLSPSFALQPEVLYASVAETGFLYIPVMAKYYIIPQFSLQVGPQINLALEAEEGENTFGLDAAFGLGYSINQNFFIDARYALELTNRVQDSPELEGYDISGAYNTLMIGVGYIF